MVIAGCEMLTPSCAHSWKWFFESCSFCLHTCPCCCCLRCCCLHADAYDELDEDDRFRDGFIFDSWGDNEGSGKLKPWSARDSFGASRPDSFGSRGSDLLMPGAGARATSPPKPRLAIPSKRGVLFSDGSCPPVRRGFLEPVALPPKGAPIGRATPPPRPRDRPAAQYTTGGPDSGRLARCLDYDEPLPSPTESNASFVGSNAPTQRFGVCPSDRAPLHPLGAPTPPLTPTSPNARARPQPTLLLPSTAQCARGFAKPHRVRSCSAHHLHASQTPSSAHAPL